MTCEYCDMAKEYIEDRKGAIRGEISTLLASGEKMKRWKLEFTVG